MKTLTGLLMLMVFVGCSESPSTDNQSATNRVERYNKPIDAAGAAADQVQQIRDEESNL